MYFYLYDSFLNNKKYTSILAKIENRLIDLGINGKIEKLSVLKSAQEVVEDNIKSGADTIVAVGNEATFAKIVPLVAKQNGITLGFIPVVENAIAKFLGIPLGEKACDILSSRLIERIDLGKANDFYFFSELNIPESKDLTLECNGGHFRINSTNHSNIIQICNLTYTPLKREVGSRKFCDPRDGLLEAIFTPTTSFLGRSRLDLNKRSVFPIRKIKIKSSNSLSLIADGETVIKTPVLVQVAPKKLKLIVGKERKF
ncbi:MAG: hypothetical protein COT24_05115 [Candidatus Kerfeldbacteria bacterium CG08_land_8_20_14_0_20_40_16]|uniref:DAGKc domain-containing protein n=1 Tax=Candidatus Kerfeldbacteria bacterium CG08_land_8_20_14_0_20_40_16 TaxID=2014244 RepID=A0A2H0YUJ6_9BACT|nr:MAG: hypothetical protein COT24_05115 [Candidatus Kerfeldbacteria bacterium CG08_land_8_20_14_0_20_40_16]